MTKPKTNWSGVSKNDTFYEVNRDLQSVIDNYDSATDSYDGDGNNTDINYYNGFNANTGSLNTTKKDTNWTP